MVNRCFDPFVANARTIGALTPISEILGGLEHERFTWDSQIEFGPPNWSLLREVGATCRQSTSRFGCMKRFYRLNERLMATYLITNAFGGLPVPPAMLRGADTKKPS